MHTENQPIHISQCQPIATLRQLLEAAAAARRHGDRGAADLLEQDAVVLLRAQISEARNA